MTPSHSNLSAGEEIERIITQAYAKGASDAHIDSTELGIMVRLRIDGHLEYFATLPRSVHDTLIARLKVLAELRIDEHARPQDGRFKFSTANEVIDIRISIAPTFFGENAVLRLLRAQASLTLEMLGLLPAQQRLLASTATRTQGLVLVTGPTGCGKTTTLYALMRLIARRPVSLVTIEDPVEYSVSEAVQMQVNTQAGLTFAEGLRGMLRQDPDAIMVGEVRDAETASLVINAALTGHLVLSTLHTNGVLGVFPRMIDLRVDPYLISSCLSLIVAQRLVRKICPECRTSKELTGSERPWAEEALGTPLPSRVFYGIGCELCSGKGYKGRIGLFDVVSTSREFLRNAQRREQPAGDQVSALIADGVEKVGRGETTVEELLTLSHAETF